LKKRLSAHDDNVEVIDIRSAEEYQKQHLPFSKNIPAAELENAARNSLKTDATIVCVCNKGHERSQQAADTLNELGYENAFYLEGGMLNWLEKEA
jgi:rhodanese-related sulfurtransferase